MDILSQNGNNSTNNVDERGSRIAQIREEGVLSCTEKQHIN